MADKWWHLRSRRPEHGSADWRASAYDDDAEVIREATADVNKDVRSVLTKLELIPDEAAQSG